MFKSCVTIDTIKHENVKFKAPAQKLTHDLTITFSDHTIHVSKSLLIERCQYFRMMLDSKFQEAGANKVDIKFDVDVAILKEVLKYIQTGEVLLSRINLDSVCRLASYFMLDELTQFCCNTLKQNINCETVVYIHEFGKDNHFLDVSEVALAFKKKNFQTILNSRVFLEWDITAINELLCSDLVVLSEKKVLKFMFDWLLADLDNRLENAAELFQKLRFSYLEIEDMVDGRFAEGDKSGQLGQILAKISMDFSNKVTPPRKYREGIYLFGSCSNNSVQFERYHPRDGSVEKLKPMNIFKNMKGKWTVDTVVNNEKLYVFGVPSKNRFLIHVFEYDPSTDIWTELTLMDMEYTYVTSLRCCSFKDDIYVFLADGAVLVYHVTTDTWTHTPHQTPTSHDVQFAAACGDSIYLVLISSVIGPTDRLDVDIMLKFKPATGEWTEIPCGERQLWKWKPSVAHRRKLLVFLPTTCNVNGIDYVTVFDATTESFQDCRIHAPYDEYGVNSSFATMFKGSLYIVWKSSFIRDFACVFEVNVSHPSVYYRSVVPQPYLKTNIRVHQMLSVD